MPRITSVTAVPLSYQDLSPARVGGVIETSPKVAAGSRPSENCVTEVKVTVWAAFIVTLIVALPLVATDELRPPSRRIEEIRTPSPPMRRQTPVALATATAPESNHPPP